MLYRKSKSKNGFYVIAAGSARIAIIAAKAAAKRIGFFMTSWGNHIATGGSNRARKKLLNTVKKMGAKETTPKD